MVEPVQPEPKKQRQSTHILASKYLNLPPHWPYLAMTAPVGVAEALVVVVLEVVGPAVVVAEPPPTVYTAGPGMV